MPALTTLPITIPEPAIADFYARHHIRRLSLFGSVLTERFGPESDIDMLVEFHPQHVPSLFGMVRMENELTTLLGRKVDFRTAGDLSRWDDVVRNAWPIHSSDAA